MGGVSQTTLVHVLLISKVHYCNTLYMGLPLKLTWKLLQVENVGARVVSGVNNFDHIYPVLIHPHWLSAVFWARFKVLRLVYKDLNNYL